MRWRLLFASAIPPVAAVVLLGLPLGLLAQREVVNDARLRLSAHAAAVGRTVQDRLGDDLPVTPETVTGLLPPGTSAVVRRPGHPPVQAGPKIPAPRLTSTVPLQSGTGAGDKPGGAVELTTSRDELDESIYRRWAVVAALAVLAGLIAVLVGRGMARRLGRPLRALADQASRIGAGDLRPSGRRYGICEVDRVAAALDGSKLRIANLLERERAFASEASHQLRSPLAALALRLDEIGGSDDPAHMREEAQSGLDQVERLASVVDSFLADVGRQRSHTAVPADVGTVLVAQRREWEPLFRSAGRVLVVGGLGRPAWALVTPGSLAQVIGTLLENALRHGAGTVTAALDVSAGAVVLSVSDEGPGIPPSSVQGSSNGT